jgi:glycine betaine/choline ABC-type transport system substrate-binding protein
MSAYLYRTFAIGLTLLLLCGNLLPANAQDNSADPAGPPIRIGSKEFSEQLLLGKMLVLLLQAAGYPVEDKTATGGSLAVRSALEGNEIDIYPEYTGTALSVYHDLPSDALPNSPVRAYELARSLDAPAGLVWLDAAEINNTYTLMVRQELIDQGITSLVELATYMNENDARLTICVESEFYGRPDGLSGLQTVYDFAFNEENILVMEANETYNNLRNETCDIAEGYSTDGRIQAWGFTNLADPLAFFPFYNPAPVARQEILDIYPEIADLINGLWQTLDNATMTELNARVDIGADGILANGDEEAIEDVAYNFLVSKRLVKPAAIKVGSKEFNEQLLLGKLIVLLLQDAGYEVEDMTGLGGSPAVRTALENGEIDLYPEYTGTATSLHHNLPVSALPADAKRTYLLAKSLDTPKNLVWLDPAPLNNTFTLMVGQQLIDEDITSLEDLANYMNTNDSPLKVCVEGEFFSRQDGLLGLQELYGFAFQEENILVMEPNETYDNLRNRTCDVAEGFATDGRITAWGFRNLQDPLAFFPFYQPAPIVRAETLNLYPDIADLLNMLMGGLDDATMSALNARVDIGADGELASGDEETVEDVAYSYLREKRLIKLPEVVVSSADASETYQQMLGKLLLFLLADQGYQVVDQTNFGSGPLVREALEKGDIDLYMESVSTALANYAGLPVTALPTDRNRAYQLMKSLDADQGVVWMAPTSYTPAYTIIAQSTVTDLGITDLTALAQYMNENDAPLTICMGDDFYSRALDGLLGLEDLYAFLFKPENIFLVDTEDIYNSFEAGECDLAVGFNVEAIIRQYTVLADPLAFFPATVVAPVIREEVLSQNPELTDLIGSLTALITNEMMAELEEGVELGPDGIEDSGDETDLDTVVRDFLVTNGLVSAEAAPIETPEEADGAPASATENGADLTATSAITESAPITDSATLTEAATIPTASDGGITVASMNDPEQILLGQLFVLTLQNAGYPVVNQTGAGASPDLRSALASGEIDLYPEFPRTALTLFHNIPTGALPTDAEGTYELARSLDEAFDFVWLRQVAFDSAYGFLTRPDLADNPLTTVTDLKALIDNQSVSPTFCVDTNFAERTQSDPLTLLTQYDITVASEDLQPIPPDAIYNALRDGRCDVALALQTDGHVSAWNLTVLQDSLNLLPPYVAAPVVRRTTLEQYPELATAFVALEPLLDNTTITAINARVALGSDGEAGSGDEESIAAVAQAFLCEQALITACEPTSAPATDRSTEVSGEIATIPLPVPPVTIVNPITPVADAPTPVTAPAEITIEVLTPDSYGVNARATADIAAVVVTVLPRSAPLVAIGRTADNDWLQIQLPNEQIVWVFTAAVLTNLNDLLLLPVVTPP